MNPALLRLRPLAPVLVLAVAALLRLWALGRPGTLVFDELYYVRDAVSQLAHGFPTTWPDDEAEFGGERALAFSDDPSTIAHPPLGKWLIGLGILLLGADTGWGWRIATALAGVATVGVTMRLGWRMTRSMWVACVAGLLLALDGVHVVLSRVALLDGFLTLFVALGALALWRDWEQTSGVAPRKILWRRPWLLAAGLLFGGAAAIKWSGLYPLAAFLLLVTLRDLWRRLCDAQLRRAAMTPPLAAMPLASPAEPPRPLQRTRATLQAALQALVTAVIALPAAALSYLTSWLGWIVNPGGQFRKAGEPWWVSLWNWHTHMLSWHASLTAEHPFQAHPLTWPLGLRPTAMYAEHEHDIATVVSPIPNLLVTWGGVAALLLLAWAVLRSARIAVRERTFAPLRTPELAVAAFVLTGYLSGWLPWVLTFSRSAVFQFYSVVMTPFAALALALVLAALAGAQNAPRLYSLTGMRLDSSAEAVTGRRLAVAVFLVFALIVALLFWPLWSGTPIAEWFYRLHIWLPGWR